MTPLPLDPIDGCVLRYRDLIQPAPLDIDTIDRYRNVCENILAGQYRLHTLAVGQRIYENQIFQNSVLLWMVVTITVSGVVLAGLQLWATYRLAVAGKGSIADGGEATIEQNRLVVRSSVIGVVILALSFAFFTLYILYVYRIADVPGLERLVPPPRHVITGAREVPR